MDSYLVGESDSNIAFAVLTGNSNKEFTEKMVLAIKEEFCYESVTPNGNITKIGGDIAQEFNCTLDDGDEEIRVIKLTLTAIY